MMSPVVVSGDRALNAAVAEVCPVPPLVIGTVGRSEVEMVPTVTAAPVDACLRNWPVPPVAERFAPVPPRARASWPVVMIEASSEGMSAATNARNAGAAGEPVDGPAQTVLTA